MEPAPRVLEETWQTAQMLRLSAQEIRALARAAVERARKAQNRVHRLKAGVERATGPTEIQRRITLRDEALDALKQSLRDLRSLRLVSPDDTEVAKLTADIRKTLQRSGGLG